MGNQRLKKIQKHLDDASKSLGEAEKEAAGGGDLHGETSIKIHRHAIERTRREKFGDGGL